MKKVLGFVVVSIMALSLSGCCGHCPFRAEKIKSYKVAMGSHSAVTPVDRPDDWWKARHEGVLKRVQQGNVDMIFIGDSITHGFDGGGKQMWDKYYAPRNAVNMGFSGDRTQNVLWRLDNGEIAGISPKLAVIMIGTNNSNTAKEIADGIVAICKTLRADLPKTKILVLAIFPRGEKPSAHREKNAEASMIVSTIADNKWIYFMNINDMFLTADGTLPADVMPDFLHPNEKGYKIWAEAIELQIQKLMK